MKESIDQKGQKKGKNFLKRLSIRIFRLIRFITYDMWRITDEEVSAPRRLMINAFKSIYLSTRNFIQNDLGTQASALTLKTILSIVPMLAVLVGIAKGFGFQEIVRDFLKEYLPGHQNELDHALGYVENYLSQVQGGVFIGIGLLILLYTAFSLIATIEDTFVNIWQTNKKRTWKRRIIDYTGAFFLLPILMTVSSGLTLMMTTIKGTYFSDYIFFGPMLEFILNLIPFIIIILLITGMYIAIPTVKVHFFPALVAGVLAGVCFQIFQALYISGILWISKYNAIYGSFAAIPLLLLWIELSWTIILFGAQLCFSIQNIKKFAFEKDTSNVSRRYLDFMTIVITSLIVKRFVGSEHKPHTIDSLTNESKAPIRLVARIVHRLLDLGIIMEVNYGKDPNGEFFNPAIDPDKMTVGYILDSIDRSGSESFKVDKKDKFLAEWEATEASREGFFIPTAQTLLKNI